MPRIVLAAILALSLALAGCTGEKEEPIDAQSVDDAEDEAPAPTPVVTKAPPKPTPASPTPKPASNGTTSNGTAGSPGAPGENGTAGASSPGVVTVEGDTGAAVMVGGPEPVGATGASVAFAALDIPRASPENGTLVATWTSASPLDASMDVSLVDVDGNAIAAGSGASPLTIEIPGEAFMTSTELRAVASPTAPGAAAEYTVHVVLTVTYV